MRKVPCDIGELQAEFDDAVCSMFEDETCGFEVLDRNMSDDPFEPDIVVMDEDEWAFNILCYYIEDLPSDGIAVVYPTTFGMRKWVQDDSDKPAFLALGIGGTPRRPEYLYFARFFNFSSPYFHMDSGKDLLLNWMRPPFFHKVIRDEFDRLFSPQ